MWILVSRCGQRPIPFWDQPPTFLVFFLFYFGRRSLPPTQAREAAERSVDYVLRMTMR